TITFGRYVELVRSRHLLPPRAIDKYAVRLRGLVAEIAGIKGGKKRFAAGSAARAEWLARIDAVPLKSVTPEMVRQWKEARLAKTKNPITRKHAINAVNSTLRQARALFGERKVLKHLPQIPRPYLFENVEYEPRVDSRFFGVGITAAELLRHALNELGNDNRQEELKAFLLGLALGLRRKEADLLEWSSFDFNRGTIQIRPTEFHALKTEKSAAILSLD